MCSERPGVDRRGQGPLLLGVGFGPAQTLSEDLSSVIRASGKTGRGPAFAWPPGQVLNLSEYVDRYALRLTAVGHVVP